MFSSSFFNLRSGGLSTRCASAFLSKNEITHRSYNCLRRVDYLSPHAGLPSLSVGLNGEREAGESRASPFASLVACRIAKFFSYVILIARIESSARATPSCCPPLLP